MDIETIFSMTLNSTVITGSTLQLYSAVVGVFSTGGSGARGGGRGGQSEGRRATISSALELEGTVSHEGDLTHFITKNLEQKIKMSSKPSLDCSDCEYETEANFTRLDLNR